MMSDRLDVAAIRPMLQPERHRMAGFVCHCMLIVTQIYQKKAASVVFEWEKPYICMEINENLSLS